MCLPKGEFNKKINLNDLEKNPFVLFQAHPDDFHAAAKSSNKQTRNSKSNLSLVFFHPKNIELIQKQIILDVYEKSNKKYWIEKQSKLDLQIVMEWVFTSSAKHFKADIREQITELNNIVVAEIVPGILSEIDGYFGYLKRAFGPLEVMDRPQNVSNAGKKTLPSVSNRW